MKREPSDSEDASDKSKSDKPPTDSSSEVKILGSKKRQEK
jgi:hypothetical protein